ncbi:MAG: hypothetical protein SGI77_19415 [Pirellulaceae bacterium]|nr:hypothetical protein [Pirellulaceae bacterium]
MLRIEFDVNRCFSSYFSTVRQRLFAIGVLVAGLAGCDRDPLVRVYEVPKVAVSTPQTVKVAKRFLIAIVPESDSAFFIKATDAPERLDSFSEPLRQIAADFKLNEAGKPEWKLPQDWVVQLGNAIAAAILEAPAEGEPVRFVVTQLPMPTDEKEREGYLSDNINLWRKQLGLAPNKFADQKSDLIEVARSEGSSPAYLLDLTGTSSSVPGMMGGSSMGSNPPPTAPLTQSPPKSAPPRKSAVQYVAPEGWTDVGASGMREASFTIGDESSKAEVTVIFASGDQLSNVERWHGQLNPSDEANVGKEAAIKAIEAATTVKAASDTEGKMFSLLGPEGDDQPAMLAAILPTGNDKSSVFIKFTGSAKLAGEHREKFIQFISSLQW